MTLDDYKLISQYTLNQVKADANKKERLIKAYFEIFREPLVISCENCINDAIIRIKYFLKKSTKFAMEPKSKFRLKERLVLYIPGLHLHVTNSNLTDAYAWTLLKISRANLSNFVDYPRDEVAKFFGMKPVNVVTTVVDEEGAKSDVVTKTLPFSIDDVMKDNTKQEIIEKLGDFPHEISWSKTRLAEQLIKKFEEESHKE